MSGGIYTIRVQGSDKFYVGRTLSFQRRKAHHLWLLRRERHHCKHLQNAFNKYGSVEFVVERVENDKELRIQLEQQWIDQHKDSGLLVNHHMKASMDDAGGKPWKLDRPRVLHNKGKPSLFKGIKRDPAIAKKISDAKKGKPPTEKQLLALVENRKKIDPKKPRSPMSEAAKKHLSDIRKGVKRGPYSEAHGLAVSKGRMGMKFTDEHKANLKKAAQNRKKGMAR
jgi:group I intron endonuclease